MGVVTLTRISPLRGSESFKRKAGKRAPRSISLIVCEGETERQYFQELRVSYELLPAEVIVAENNVGSAPISVVQCAEQKANERGGYDFIFCVFDRDTHESFDRARQKIKTLTLRSKKPLPIREVISIPCFEIWVLLHHECTDVQFANSDEVSTRIRSQHMPQYSKANAKSIKQLMPLIEKAIENATWLENRAETNNWDPYTSVHLLVNHMKTVAMIDSH